MIDKLPPAGCTLPGLLAAASFAAAAALAGNAVAGPGPKGHSHAVFAAGAPGDPKKQARTIEIAMREANGEMMYVPAEIHVRQGAQVKLILKNEGELDHEFMLDSFEGNGRHKIEMEKNPEKPASYPVTTRPA